VVVGFVVFLLVSIASATIAVIALHVVGAGVSRVALRYTERTLAVERVRFQAERVVTTTRGYLLARAPVQLARLEDAVAALDARVRELRES
jgi:CHASE3 domain sensor protein